MSEETLTFESGIEIARRWAKLKIDISTCEALRERFRDAESHPEFALLIAAYNVAEPELRRELSQRINWADCEDSALVLIAETHFGVKRAVRDFLPAPLDCLQLADKWQWFVAYFLWLGAQQRPSSPLFYALSNTFFIQVGRGAVDEIRRRFQGNVGAAGGAISYLTDPDIPYLAGIEDLVDKAADRIGKSALKAVIKKHANYYDAIARFDKDELRSQVHRTWLKDFSQQSPARTLAWSLDGTNSNPIGIAVARNMVDRVKTEQAAFERTIDLESDKLLDDFEDIRFTIEDYPLDPVVSKANESQARLEKLYLDLGKFTREYPDHGRAIRAKLDKVPRDEQAKQAGVSVRTIGERLNQAEQAFKKWIETRYR
jgi:hypothetical protein